MSGWRRDEDRVSLAKAEEITLTTIKKLEAAGTPQAAAMRQLAQVLLALVQSQARSERDIEMLTKRVAVLLNEAGIDPQEYLNPQPE